MSRAVARGRQLRSEDQVTESTNKRVVQRGAVDTTELVDRAATAIKQWPGGVRVRPGDLTPETVQELDGRFVTGRTLTLTRTTSQTVGHNAGAGEDVSFTTQVGDRVGFTAPSLPTSAPPLPADAVWTQTVVVELASLPSGSEVLVVDGSGGRLWPKGVEWIADSARTSPLVFRFVVPHRRWGRDLQPSVRIIPPDGETVDVNYAEATWGIEGSQGQPPLNTWVQALDGDAWGLTRLGGSWWVTERVGNRVVEYDDSWVEQSSFTAGTTVDGGGVRGIATDGTDLFVTGDGDAGGSLEERIWKYTTAGTLLSEFATGPSGADGNDGLAFDGTDLWLSERNAQEIERWSTAGVREAAFSWPGGAAYRGLDFYDGHLWTVDVTAATVVKLTTGGTVVATVDVSGATTSPTGLYIDLNGTLYVAEDDVGVWRNEGLLQSEGLL